MLLKKAEQLVKKLSVSYNSLFSLGSTKIYKSGIWVKPELIVLISDDNKTDYQQNYTIPFLHSLVITLN